MISSPLRWIVGKEPGELIDLLAGILLSKTKLPTDFSFLEVNILG